MKSKFYQPRENTLIKATLPMERSSLDFKGSVPSVNSNNYLLIVVDEFSRFPWLSRVKIQHRLVLLNVSKNCSLLVTRRAIFILIMPLFSYRVNLNNTYENERLLVAN